MSDVPHNGGIEPVSLFIWSSRVLREFISDHCVGSVPSMELLLMESCAMAFIVDQLEGSVPNSLFVERLRTLRVVKLDQALGNVPSSSLLLSST